MRAYIKSIKLQNFRSYHKQDFSLDNRHVVVVGRNGSGKTNLLEALSIFMEPRGLRHAKAKDLLCQTLPSPQPYQDQNENDLDNAHALPAMIQEWGVFFELDYQIPNKVEAETETKKKEYKKPYKTKTKGSSYHNDDRHLTLVENNKNMVNSCKKSHEKQTFGQGGLMQDSGRHDNRHQDATKGKGSKKYYHNGDKVSMRDFRQALSIFWMTPEMDRRLSDSPSNRRDFFDYLVMNFYPKHADHLELYEKMAKERLTLLKNNAQPDDFWLGIIEEKLAHLSLPIMEARLDIMQLLNETPYIHTDLPHYNIHIDCKDSHFFVKNDQKEEKAITFILDRFKQQRSMDAMRGMTTGGMMRSKIEFFNQSKKIMAHLCSTGEQKLLLLQMIMIAAKNIRAQYPEKAVFLLLDEIVSHLDPVYKNHIFTAIHTMNIQCWMTGTSEHVFREFDTELVQMINLDRLDSAHQGRALA